MLKTFNTTHKVTNTKINKMPKIAIVTSLYHSELTKSMEKACIDVLLQAGVKKSNISVFNAPGSWEIPIITQHAASSKKFDGIAAFGLILKGETYHFEMIANECARGLMNISLAYHIPIALEVLAVYDMKQALARTKGDRNKGIEAAQALLAAIQVMA